MIEALRDFKRIRPADTHRLAGFFAGFARTRRYPRFYMTPLWLSTKSEFIHGVIDGCLCIVKRRAMYRHPVIYLIVPPMHPEGDLKSELAVLRRFQKRGIGARLSEEDVALYGLSDAVIPDKGNSEYIYKAGNYLNLSGKENANWRHQWNEIAARCQVQTLRRRVPSAAAAQCLCVDTLWRDKRRLSTAHATKLVRSFSDYDNIVPGYLHIIETDSVPRAYSMTQQILPGWVGILLRQHDFTGAVSDYSRAQHLLDTRPWAETSGPDTLLNIGSSVGVAGLARAKEKLRPERVLPIYRLPGDVPLTMEDYHSSKPRPENNGFGLL